MPDLYTPIDGQPWPQERFARQAPTWGPSGVIGAVQSAYGNGPAALSFSVAGSVITVALAVFRANARGFLYERTGTPWQTGQAAASGSDATAAYALNTNANPRRDRLVLRRDLAAGRIYPFILQGTPAASPTAPTLTQVDTGAWDTPLFSWTLAGSSSTSISNITDERGWVPASGSGALGCFTLAARNANFPTPQAGDTVQCLGTTMVYGTSAWQFTLQGTVSIGTDASGYASFAHGAGQGASQVQLTVVASATPANDLRAKPIVADLITDPAQIKVRVANTETSSWFANNAFTLFYDAKFS